MKSEILEKISKEIKNSKLVRYLLLIALGWSIAQILVYFSSLITITTLSAILAFLLNYPVRWFKRFFPHSLAVTLVFCLSILIIGIVVVTLGLAIVSQAMQLLGQAPEWVAQIQIFLEQLQTWLIRRHIRIDLTIVEKAFQTQVVSGVQIGLVSLQSILTYLIDFILIAVVAFFMLLNGQPLWDFMLKPLAPHLRQKLTEAIEKNFLGFFWGRVLLSGFFAFCCFWIFVIYQTPFPLLLAAIVGIFDLIPGIGTILGIIVIFLIILPQGIGLSAVSQILIICTIIQQIKENLLMPRIMQDSVNVNPVVMFLSLLLGFNIAGLIGLFLGIPVAGVLISFFDIEEMKANPSKRQ